MRISVPLENGYLPDRHGKYADAELMIDGHPFVSFPIEIADVPEGTVSLAVEFVDYDAIPVGGFCWIHWLACNIDPHTQLIPDNASALELIDMVQGTNSDWSPLAGAHSKPQIIKRYAGPFPPDKDHEYTLIVYALDIMLELEEGYYQNEFRKAVRGHVLKRVELDFMSRA